MYFYKFQFWAWFGLKTFFNRWFAIYPTNWISDRCCPFCYPICCTWGTPKNGTNVPIFVVQVNTYKMYHRLLSNLSRHFGEKCYHICCAAWIFIVVPLAIPFVYIQLLNLLPFLYPIWQYFSVPVLCISIFLDAGRKAYMKYMSSLDW